MMKKIKPQSTQLIINKFAVLTVVKIGLFLILTISLIGQEPKDRVELWIKNLSHENALTRKNASYYLGEIKDKRAIEPLISSYQKEPDYKVKVAMIKAVGQVGDYSILDKLREDYKNEQNSYIKRVFISTIERLETIKTKAEKEAAKKK